MLTENEKQELTITLAEYLVDEGLAEAERGHGHATAVQVAESIMASVWLRELISTAVGDDDMLLIYYDEGDYHG